MKETIIYRCFVCGSAFEWGHDSYHTGRMAPIWREMVCASCDQPDGTFPSDQLKAKLASKGIEPVYNSEEFIVVPR